MAALAALCLSTLARVAPVECAPALLSPEFAALAADLLSADHTAVDVEMLPSASAVQLPILLALGHVVRTSEAWKGVRVAPEDAASLLGAVQAVAGRPDISGELAAAAGEVLERFRSRGFQG